MLQTENLVKKSETRLTPKDEFHSIGCFYFSLENIFSAKGFCDGYRYKNKAADIAKKNEAKPCISKIPK